MFKNTTDWISVGNRKRESEEEMYIHSFFEDTRTEYDG